MIIFIHYLHLRRSGGHAPHVLFACGGEAFILRSNQITAFIIPFGNFKNNSKICPPGSVIGTMRANGYLLVGTETAEHVFIRYIFNFSAHSMWNPKRGLGSLVRLATWLSTIHTDFVAKNTKNSNQACHQTNHIYVAFFQVYEV